MFSMCSELTPRARIPDTRIPQLMQPWVMAEVSVVLWLIGNNCCDRCWIVGLWQVSWMNARSKKDKLTDITPMIVVTTVG